MWKTRKYRRWRFYSIGNISIIPYSSMTNTIVPIIMYFICTLEEVSLSLPHITWIHELMMGSHCSPISLEVFYYISWQINTLPKSVCMDEWAQVQECTDLALFHQWDTTTEETNVRVSINWAHKICIFLPSNIYITNLPRGSIRVAENILGVIIGFIWQMVIFLLADANFNNKIMLKTKQ
jgi:hypothetical protein